MRDMMGLMKQAQQMQQKMADMQAELETIEVEGAAGGGMVTVTMTAKGALKGVKIDPSLMVPDEREILEDLIVAAHRDAHAKAEAAIAEKMAEMTGGMGLPGGFKLPF